jgi:uncharacterized membrane-anchored protein YhcB (DUF1043 family)
LAEIDLTNVIIPLIVGIVVPFIIIFLSKFGKTQEGTLTGTIRLEGLQNNVEETRVTMDKGFNKIETSLNSRESEIRSEFQIINKEVTDLCRRVSLSEYRIDRLERERGWQGGVNTKKEDKG